MADLNDRGQMLLVGGLAVAVSIVVLVLLLNSAIYTQNVATRGGGVDGESALEYRAVMTDATAELLAAENDRDYETADALWRNATRAVDNVSVGLRDQWVSAVAVASLDSQTLHNGTRVVQSNQSRELTDASGAANWSLASNAGGIRSFEIRPTAVTGGPLDLEPDSESTRVNVSGGGATWRLYVYNNSADEPTLAVLNGSESGDPTDVCGGYEVGDPIDLTAGTVDGTDCPGIDFAKGTAKPWNVSVTYGNLTAGSYNATVNTTDVGDLNDPGSGASPREEPILFSAHLELTYRAPELTYETRVRVVPGEDGG